MKNILSFLNDFRRFSGGAAQQRTKELASSPTIMIIASKTSVIVNPVHELTFFLIHFIKLKFFKNNTKFIYQES
jgi:hypothetical protein